MYTYSRAIRGGMAAALLLSLTLTTAAQTIPAARPQEARVVCGARGIARQQCGADLRGYVFSRLVDAAGSHCEIGRNFGYSDAAVWVEQNCGGEFFCVYRGARTAVPVAAGAGSADRAVRCESQDGRPASCPMDLSTLVLRDIRQLSRTQCVDRQNWRWDDRGVYVDQGCRADFVFGPRTDSQSTAAAAARSVACSSRDGRRADCPADLSGYAMRGFRQVSRSACLAGQSFGHTDRGVWAGQGCRVELQFDYVGNRGRGYGSATALPPTVAAPGGVFGTSATPLRCESVDNARNYCDVAFAVRARVRQQLSRTACTEGSTWGLDNRGIWVDRGCRADFEVFH